MKVVFIALLVLSNLFVAFTAAAKDTQDALQNHLAFCSQFIINDPDPRTVLNHMRDCCAFSQHIRDCHMYDWGTIERW